MEAIAMSNKAWGGRFEVQPEEWVDDFNASITFDQTLIDQDIEGSIAHATMLANQGIISQQDSCILDAVETIKLQQTCTCTLRNKCKISSH